MKKAYKKPEIMFEDFSLSCNIAAGCEPGGIVGNPSKGVCGVLTSSGDVIFNSSVGDVCVFKPSDMGNTPVLGNDPDDEWDGFCYHVPTESSNLFNS